MDELVVLVLWTGVVISAPDAEELALTLSKVIVSAVPR